MHYAGLRIDARTQALTALLRHSMKRGVMDTLAAETLTLALLRRTLDLRNAND
jgi:hypothetical protein